MAVLVEGVSVVVRRAAVEARYPGGLAAFLGAVPTSQASHDDHLVRVGFMDTSDARAYAESLVAAAGLRFDAGDNSDVAVVDQQRGPWTPAPHWLAFARVPAPTGDGGNLAVCFLAGHDPGKIVAPPGWTYERSLSNPNAPGFMHESQLGDRLKFLRREENVEVYLDRQTGKELYVGRPTIAGDAPAALNTQLRKLFDEALAVERKGYVPTPPPKWQFWRRPDPRYQKLTEELLPAATRIAEGPGRDLPLAHFVRGVTLRLLGRTDDAVAAFLKARELNPKASGILRDLVRCLGEAGRPKEALPYAREAAALDETDPSLLGNLAACLMQCGELAEAKQVIGRALELEPGDQINQAIRRQIAASTKR